MHPATRTVAAHMREFGLAALARAAYDLTFSINMHPYASAMAIGQAGHGAELTIKARIAEEHPLLLFTTLPKSATTEDKLTWAELFQFGRTVQYQDLPELLWAATGFRMERVEQFIQFGKLRNGCIHFALPPTDDWHGQTIRFLFEVMEPLTQTFWSQSIATHSGLWDEVMLDGFLEKQIVRAGVRVTPELEKALTHDSLLALYEQRRKKRGELPAST